LHTQKANIKRGNHGRFGGKLSIKRRQGTVTVFKKVLTGGRGGALKGGGCKSKILVVGKESRDGCEGSTQEDPSFSNNGSRKGSVSETEGK